MTWYCVLTPLPCGPFLSREKAEEAAIAAIGVGKDARIIDQETAAELVKRGDLPHYFYKQGAEKGHGAAAESLRKMVQNNPVSVKGALERSARQGDQAAKNALADLKMEEG